MVVFANSASGPPIQHQLKKVFRFEDAAINYSLYWLFVIFLANDTLSGLPLLSEQVNDGHTIVKDMQKAICLFFFKTGLPGD